MIIGPPPLTCVEEVMMMPYKIQEVLDLMIRFDEEENEAYLLLLLLLLFVEY